MLRVSEGPWFEPRWCNLFVFFFSFFTFGFWGWIINFPIFRNFFGDFVTTEDGTGIVHLAPAYGADDFRVAQKYGVGTLHLVDNQGRFKAEVTDFAGEYVKEQYLKAEQITEDYKSIDVRISIKLKEAPVVIEGSIWF